MLVSALRFGADGAEQAAARERSAFGVGLLAAKRKSAGGAVVVGARLPELLVSRSTSRAGLDWFGLVWTGLDWFGLVWTGLDWFGLVWTGLDWFGLVWTLADGSAREVSLHIIRISPKPDVSTVSHPWLAVNRAPEFQQFSVTK